MTEKEHSEKVMDLQIRDSEQEIKLHRIEAARRNIECLTKLSSIEYNQKSLPFDYNQLTDVMNHCIKIIKEV